ncbi:MAG: ISKra4 family transposase, partial [Egibacteraceae bacterium]
QLQRRLYQDHLDLRAAREADHHDVTGADRVERTRTETGHHRKLATVFGEVSVERKAYRAPGACNLHPADAALNLPVERHSHGLRKLAALESTRGSFEDAAQAIGRATGTPIGKRQVEQLAARAAADVCDFYEARERRACPDSDVLVISADGKGIVMRPQALREQTARAAQNSGNKLQTRLSRGEKRNRKRMAEVGAVYDITPVVRAPADIIGSDQPRQTEPTPGPKARDKWLVASVDKTTAEVIAAVFDEACRRDPDHRRPWVALVDGNAHQISRIQAEAAQRDVKVSIVLDFVHVLEYLWKAAWSFFAEGDPAVERWVAGHAVRVLEGGSGVVAAAIRRKATTNKLPPDKRKGADACADYLVSRGPYLSYAHALSSGWPIAAGIIEGACRHLVKDRMDITGARWGLPGAEAVLELRALVSNGDFDDYWDYHLTQEHERVHCSHYLGGQVPGETMAA